MENKISLRQLAYELKVLINNWYIPFFGLIFPILMVILLSFTVLGDVPEKYLPIARGDMVLNFSPLIILAIQLLGHGSIYSQELEKNIPLRLELFGISKKSSIKAKLITQFILSTFALIIFYLITLAVLRFEQPTAIRLLTIFLILSILSIVLFILAHGICLIIRKFNAAYAVLMTIYFSIMILSGMMGIPSEKLPVPLKFISSLIPFSYFQSDIRKFWEGKPMNFAPFIQAFIFFSAITGIILIFALRRKD